MAELIVAQIPRGELIHPNGFYICATFYEQRVFIDFGRMTNWVLQYVQTQQPYWMVTTCDSGPFKELGKKLKLFKDPDAREEQVDVTGTEDSGDPVFQRRYLGEWVDNKLAVSFSFAPIGIKELIDGYPWRTESP